MDRLAFLADEHVPNVIGTALRSNGYDIELGRDHLEAGADDLDLLVKASALDRVLLTNDRDFVSLGKEVDHAGIVIYVEQDLAPGLFVRGIHRVDGQFTPQAMRNNIEWLEDWIG